MTKTMIRLECSRAFCSRGFWLALLLGCGLAVAHVALAVVPIAWQQEEWAQMALPMFYPATLYDRWMGSDSSHVCTYLYFLLIPLLASLPHGDSFFADIKGGFIHNLCLRVSKRAYYTGKFTATFLSGGVAVTLPLAFNFLLTATILPAIKPQPAAFVSLIGETSTFSDLYYQRPLLYVLLFFILIFIFSGFWATLCLPISHYVGYSFFVLAAPFIGYLFLNTMANLLRLDAWQPVNFLMPGYAGYARLPLLILPMLTGLVSFFWFVIRGEQDVC